jgi:hypothetical protein
MDFIQSMLSSNVVPISGVAWKKARETTSWVPDREPDDKTEERVFRFTRAMAGDRRLRFEGAMASDRMAKSLFTADRWDWTPED